MKDGFVKFISVVFFIALYFTINMCCLYVGWNRGVVPIATNGVQQIEFWHTLYLMFFFSGVFSPVVLALRNNKR